MLELSSFAVQNIGKNTANAGGHNAKATSHGDSSQVQTSGETSEQCGEWCEATTPEGYVYYWNTLTKGEMHIFTEICLYELSFHYSGFLS